MIGIVIADVQDPNHPCYCGKWLKRYEPSSGCLNGTRWVIQNCYTQLDSSCYYNTMWREECEKSATTATKTKHLSNPPLGTEWGQWSTCYAGWTTYLGIKKSDIKSSEECVAGSMYREKKCWRGNRESANLQWLPKCNGMTYKYEPINSINDTVKIRNDYNTETRLCHVPKCEWSECISNQRIRKKDCCDSICDPKVSICMPVESEECGLELSKWEKDRQAQLHQNKMRVYPIIGAIYCVSLLLFCVCLCKIRKKRQKDTNSDGTAAEKVKISEIEDSSSSSSESMAEDIIEQPSLI